MDDTNNQNSSQPQNQNLAPSDPNSFTAQPSSSPLNQSINPTSTDFNTSPQAPPSFESSTNSVSGLPTDSTTPPIDNSFQPSQNLTPPPTSLNSNPISQDLNASNFNSPPTTTDQTSNQSTGFFNTPPTSEAPTSVQSQPPQPMPTFPAQPEQLTQQLGTSIQDQAALVGSITTDQTSPSIETAEPAPTDLSQLTAGSSSQNSDVYTPPVSAPETLVVPSSQPSPPSPTTVTSASGGARRTLPLIAIIGAAIVLIAVAGASAYFILGIGKTQDQQSTSLPIVQQQGPLTKPPTPAPTPLTTTPPDASSSGEQSSFGSLNGGSTTPTPSSTNKPTSAADLLKAKQSSKPSSSPSAKPSASSTTSPNL